MKHPAPAFLACLLLSGLAVPATADRVERVRDINTGFTTGLASSPSNFFDAGNGVAYFQAYQPPVGRELWRTDGLDAFLVKDIFTGDLDSNPRSFAPGNGFTFFVADDPSHGAELWRTDGTPEGTILVKDVWPGAGGSAPLNVVSINGIAFFDASDPTSGRELWKSDGTPEGTVLVRDISPGVADSSPSALTSIAGSLYFKADDGVHGVELWKSDGTETSTFLVRDIRAGSETSNVGPLSVLNGLIYFSADNGITGAEVWRTNGTETGTILVTDVRPGSVGSNPGFLGMVSGALLFAADSTANGRELWRTSGPGATFLVRDIRLGSQSSSPSAAGFVGPFLLFTADDGVSGREIWRSDGSSGGTVRVVDLAPGSPSGVTGNFTVIGNLLFFTGGPSSTGNELWRTDGLATGTFLVRDIRPGSPGSDINFVTRVGNQAYFGANDGIHGREPWRTDGTFPGTQFIHDVYSGAASGSPTDLTEMNGTVYFIGDDGTGPDLWRSDGTEGGTGMVRDTTPPGGPTTPIGELTRVGNTLFFHSWTPTAGSELWRSDGTFSGTSMVADLCPGPCGLPQKLTDVDGTLYFTDAAGLGSELYRSDGTPGGTVLVRDIFPGPTGSNPDELTSFQGKVFFSATGMSAPLPLLWMSDGTAAGTTTLFGHGPSFLSPKYLTVMNGEVYFVASSAPFGVELWKTDGTQAGTRMVHDIRPGPSSSMPEKLVAVGNILYFRADDGFTGTELWQTDGTDMGTRRVTDLNPGPAHSWPDSPTRVGESLYFSGYDGLMTGVELWTTSPDGPPVLVEDIAPGPESSGPRDMIEVEGTLFFTANGIEGAEMWRHDDEFGTRLVADIEPGVSSSSPNQYLNVATPAGNDIYFSAYNSDDGTELRVLRNRRPLAEAGPDLFILPGQLVTLHAGGSFDPDGDALGFEWRGPTGPPLSHLPQVQVSPNETTTYVVTVRDGFGGVVEDSVTVNVWVFPPYLFLSVLGDDGGQGTVSIDPPGAMCDNLGAPQTCAYQYETGTPVTLVASPVGDSVFLGWQGECAGTGPCTLVMDADKYMTAQFRGPQSLAVTLESHEGGSGTVSFNPPNLQCVNAPGSPQTCANLYRIGTMVHLAATPSADSVFIGWTSGACSGPLQTCDVTVDQAKSTVALFRGPQPLAVTLESHEGGSGTVSLDPPNLLCANTPGSSQTCANPYRIGTVVHLVATPSPDSVFIGWTSGACSGPLQTCQVTVDEAKSTVALFRGPQPLAVTLESQEGGSGTVSLDPPNLLCANTPGSPQTCANLYRIGTVVHLTAEPSPDSVFVGWTSGACSGPLQTCQVTVDEATAATATFRLDHPPVAVPGGPYSARRNEPIAFDGTGSSDADGDPLTYAWDLGDGATSTDPSPTHAYAALGNHTVTLVVHDGRIASAPSTAVVSITNAAPAAVVGGGPQTGVRGEILTFDGSASSDPDGDPLTYAWDFGDGSTATGATATHAYATLGAFTVTLVVNDGIDSSAPASTTASITNRAPVASPGGPYAGTHAITLAFDASSSSDPDGDPLTFAWTFGDGATGTGPSPSHTYAASGSYTVTVAVSDGVDATTASTTAIISNLVPIARPGGPYASFRNAPLLLDGTASSDGNGDPLTYRWDFGDGTTGTGATPTHAYAAFGSFVVSLIVNDGAADSPAAVAVVTVPDRRPLAHAGGPYTGFRGVAITFNGAASADPDGNPLTYQWSFGDGAVGTGVSPTHVYTTAGPFVVRLVVIDGGPEPSLESTATVTLTNRPPIARPGGPYTGRRTIPVQLDGSASTDPDGDPLSYSWNFGDATTGTGVSPTHVYTTLGTKTVTLTVNDGIAISTAVTTTVTITNASPIANAGPDRTVVRNTSVTLDGRGSSDPDGTISYAWRRLSGPSVTLINPNSAQPRFTAPNVNSTKVIAFELKVTDNNGATAIDTVRITVIR